MVAAACHTLCEAANALVQGHATEERLISSAKQVASSTAALLVACKVKVGISSQAMRRLQNAGKYTFVSLVCVKKLSYKITNNFYLKAMRLNEQQTL